jgi:uncharacterized protein (UPF0332 family)
MSEEKLQAIKLKLIKAKSFLNEADILLNNKFYATVINRLYYSCFHATKALLLTKDLFPKTHSGVINQLHQHFVQPGIFDMQQASFFSRLMQERIEEDYSDLIIEDEESTRLLIEPSKKYISYVEGLINKYISDVTEKE